MCVVVVVVVVVLETTTAPGQPHLQLLIVSEGVCVKNMTDSFGFGFGFITRL